MKILQVLPALEQGGVERGTIEIARALTEEGIANGVVSSGGRMVQELEKLGVPHHCLPVGSKNPFAILRNAAAIAKIATENGYTLMHVRSRAPAWSVRRASKLCGIPWIATFHGVYGTSPRFLKIPYNRVMLDGLRTICVSDYVKKHVLETYHPDPSKLIRIHRGADTDYFRPDAVTTEQAMEKKTLHYEIPAEYPVILLPGRLTSWKGQEVLLEAAKHMKHKRIAIVFLGSDQGRTDYSDRLRSLANTLPDETRVVFRPGTTEMPKVYRMSDIVVSASSAQPEAFGRVIPEAQAMGRLVLATAHGGACETVEDGKTGFLVPPGDAPAMAAALDRILDLPDEEKNRIAAAAVESVRANFSTPKMCERTLDVYREIAGMGGAA